MKILSLELQGFRGIADFSVCFKEQTSAFVGINGAGKSSVLEALAIALSQLIWRLNGQPQRARAISLDDISRGAEFARISITIQVPEQGEVSWSIARNRKKAEHEDPKRKSQLDALNAFVDYIKPKKVADSTDLLAPKALPLAVYYDVNRAAIHIPMRVREKLNNSFYEIYRDALDHGGADFKRFFVWFRNCEDHENERRRDQQDFRDHGLESVRKAVKEFTTFENLRIRRSPLRMTVMKSGSEFSVAQLSDGERNMLAMVGDLARRLSVLNLDCPQSNDGKGVVLIDEIDLHLHPKWQRDVVRWLEKTFPHCQFIITTHSPQVIGELKAGSVMLMDEGKLLGIPERALGLNSSEVLEEVMQGRSRNEETQSSLEQVRNLIDEDNFVAASEKLDELSQKTGEIPSIYELRCEIQSLELTGEEE